MSPCREIGVLKSEELNDMKRISKRMEIRIDLSRKRLHVPGVVKGIHVSVLVAQKVLLGAGTGN